MPIVCEVPLRTRSAPRARAPELSIANLDDVKSWGWDGRRLVEEVTRLDYECIDSLTQPDEGDLDQWVPLFLNQPDTWRLMTAGPGKVAGYWHFVRLRDPEFELMTKGKLLDGGITTETVLPLDRPGQYDIYFVSLCMRPEYQKLRNARAATVLIGAFFDSASVMAQRGVFIRNFYANAYTLDGAAICECFGMHPVGRHDSRGLVYAKRFSDFPKWRMMSNYQEMIALYQREFGLDKTCGNVARHSLFDRPASAGASALASLVPELVG